MSLDDDEDYGRPSTGNVFVSPQEHQAQMDRAARERAQVEANSRTAWSLVFLILPLFFFAAASYFLLGTALSQLSQIRDVLATIYPDDWLFSVENDTGAVAVNYLVTIGVTTAVWVAAAIIARYFFLRAFITATWFARIGAFVISALGVFGLLVGAVLLLGAAQIANRSFADQTGPFITTASGQEWWPWTVCLIAVLWLALRSTSRSLRRHRNSAVRRGEAEYL